MGLYTLFFESSCQCRIHSSTPYSGIVRVLTDLCSILDMFPPVILGPEFVSILTKLVPQITNVTTYDEIEKIAGSQRRLSLSKKVGEWGFEKLKQAIRSFMKGAINVISSYSKLPVILHFDDLQWADEASLELITAFLEMKNIINGFMFVGSYRDNELESDSPFSICQKTILQFSNFHCTDISLANLTLNDVANLISNVSQMSKSKSEELARLVYDITRGNSLFVRRYLHHMLHKNLIRQCDDSKCWEYDDVQIRSKIDVVEDIDSFLVEEMRNLPVTSLEAIKLASLLGPEVEISLLESILQDLEVDLSKDTIHDILECLESRCYIDMEDDHYKVFHFVHDRILRAAHCLVTEELRQVLHLRMGRTILKQYEESQESKPSHLLLAIDQLNRGKDLIDSMTDKEELATLNLHAAHEMIALSAFNLAKSHLLIALDLLGKDCWETHYNLTLSINNLLTSVLSGNVSMLECLDLIDTISVKCMHPRDGYLTQAIRLELLACINRALMSV
jgi:predicted ATPase